MARRNLEEVEGTPADLAVVDRRRYYTLAVVAFHIAAVEADPVHSTSRLHHHGLPLRSCGGCLIDSSGGGCCLQSPADRFWYVPLVTSSTKLRTPLNARCTRFDAVPYFCTSENDIQGLEE